MSLGFASQKQGSVCRLLGTAFDRSQQENPGNQKQRLPADEEDHSGHSPGPQSRTGTPPERRRSRLRTGGALHGKKGVQSAVPETLCLSAGGFRVEPNCRLRHRVERRQWMLCRTLRPRQPPERADQSFARSGRRLTRALERRARHGNDH